MGKLLPPWESRPDRESPLTEYPRPQLERESYVNLNAPWDFAIRKLCEKKAYRAIKDRGLSAAVYTEGSNAEDGLNGLRTYDRPVRKYPGDTPGGQPLAAFLRQNRRRSYELYGNCKDPAVLPEL